MPQICDVCSARFSPLPHFHSPGNMWRARCSYVNRLLNPDGFEQSMANASGFTANGARDGTGRYAYEHWVTSHPDLVPCDVYQNKAYTWNYDGLPDPSNSWIPNISLAPRFTYSAYYKDLLRKEHKNKTGIINKRLKEWLVLFQKAPPNNSWIWRLFSENGISWDRRNCTQTKR